MSGSAIVGSEGDGRRRRPGAGRADASDRGRGDELGAAMVAVARAAGLRLADDLLARCQALLVRLYARPEPLQQQRQDLGWPEGPQTADRAAGTSSVESVASQLVARALLDGASGLLALARSGRDFPSQPEVTELSSAIEARLKLPARRSSPSRREIVDETLSELISSKNYGVALLSPLGFGARQLAHETLRRLDRSDKALLPVRLVPERGTTTDDHLYSALLRDLKSGLEEQLGTPLPPHWREPLERRSEAERVSASAPPSKISCARTARRLAIIASWCWPSKGWRACRPISCAPGVCSGSLRAEGAASSGLGRQGAVGYALAGQRGLVGVPRPARAGDRLAIGDRGAGAGRDAWRIA